MSQDTSESASTEAVDIEEFAKADRQVPQGCRYRIRIDKQMIVVDEPCLTGTEILKLVDKTPQGFLLSQKLRGGEVKRIGPDDKVDFTEPGIERFMTLPLDPTEGSGDEAETRF